MYILLTLFIVFYKMFMKKSIKRPFMDLEAVC